LQYEIIFPLLKEMEAHSARLIKARQPSRTPVSVLLKKLLNSAVSKIVVIILIHSNSKQVSYVRRLDTQPRPRLCSTATAGPSCEAVRLACQSLCTPESQRPHHDPAAMALADVPSYHCQIWRTWCSLFSLRPWSKAQLPVSSTARPCPRRRERRRGVWGSGLQGGE
jgi:hypothetical protein